MTIRAFFTFSLIILVSFAGPVSSQILETEDERGIPTIAPLIEVAVDAVVNLSIESSRPAQLSPLFQDPLFRDFFNAPEELPQQSEQQVSVGSGVIVDADAGYILTNHHVIADSERITVTLRDQRNVNAEIVGSDPATDIAVLKIDADALSEAPIGASDTLLVGDFVVAIGNPFGLGQTVTLGIVSALGRSGINPRGYEDFIQTDASINPGNSGGALITLDGKLVGINTAIMSRSGGNIGIGFAVPIAMARDVMNQIVDFGEVRRGQLGVRIQDLAPDLAAALDIDAEQGAVIVEVVPDSVAAAVGLQPGDVILAVDGTAIEGSRDLRNQIGARRPGETIDLQIIRSGTEMNVTVVLGRSTNVSAGSEPPIPPGTLPPSMSGVVLKDLTPEHPAYGKTDGVAVASITPGAAADLAGLMVGDVITKVNTTAISSKAEFDAEMTKATETIALNVWRDGRRLLLVVRTNE